MRQDQTSLQPSKEKGLAKESFAEIWALYTSDEESYTVAKQYFPKTVMEFEKLLTEIFGGEK